MKKLLALVCVLTLAMGLCSFAHAEETITLRVLAGQSTTDAGIEDMIDAALAEKYPNIKLEWECVDWGNDFQPKMQVYMQSGLPDIMIGKAQDVSTYGSLGLLADLTDKPYMDNILDAAKTGVTLDGKVMGMTFNCLYQGVYYSRAIFEDLGLSVPKTLEELDAVIATLEENGIIPFASHMVDTWSIGNVTMQFAVNDVFNKYPTWGDAMKVSGSWSIQNFLDIDENYDFGIFPFPNQTGDAKLLFEPNITFMASAQSEYQDAIDKVFEVIATDAALQQEIYDYTKTAPMVKGVTPTFPNPSQTDIDAYAAEGMIQDVNLGNNQLVWGGFQEENAKDIAEYLQGNITIEEALNAADARCDNSK